MPVGRVSLLAVGGLSTCLVLARFALATNATNFIGHSAAASAMGGADSVSVIDTSAINSNPATLSLMPNRADGDPRDRLSAAMMDLTADVLQPFLHHRDVFGNSCDGENQPFLGPHAGVAVENSVRYTNRNQPFGPNAQESPSGLSVGLTLGYRF